MRVLGASCSRQPERSFSGYVNHRNSEDNNDETPFEFTKENYAKINQIIAKYPSNYKESACIPVLFIAQKQNDNFLTLAAMNKVAKILNMEPIQVYEVASFYTMFNRTKVGKYHLQVCGTTPCMLRGAREVMKAIKDYANIEMDQTSADGLFTISEVECLGACVNAPMMQVNNEWVYEDLDPQNIVKLLDTWKSGKESEVGPQIKRQFSCGPQGRTSLQLPVEHTTHSRDFAAAKREWEEAKAKAAKK
jgi:NADH dehydrogenase (ubiquinone) flavoprotein 2